MPAERRRVAYIDGLRAVAVLLVVAHHAVVSPTIGPRSLLDNVLKHGNHGVDLFFVLSGFCLSYPTIAALREKGAALFDTSRYAAHRIVRIVPPYWIAYLVTLLGFAIILKLGYGVPDSMATKYSMTDFFKQLLFIDYHTQLLNGSFWTLPIEFRWYFIFPIALWVWVRYPLGFVTIAGLVIYLSSLGPLPIDFRMLPAFLSGIVAADLCVRRVLLGPLPAIATVVLLAIALATTRTYGWHDDFDAAWYLAAFTFVVWAGCSERLERLLSVRWLAFIGLASYSVYLMHQPIIVFLRERGLNGWIAAVAGVGAGLAFWSLAERPFMSKSRIREDLLAAFRRGFEWLFSHTRLRAPVRLQRRMSDDAV